jgi:glutamine amidotransferase
MIAIVDYGMGNLRSVHKAFERVGLQAIVTQEPGVIRKASGLVVPGVGAFKKAMENLKELGLVDALIEFIESGRPFLGICLANSFLRERRIWGPKWAGHF